MLNKQNRILNLFKANKLLILMHNQFQQIQEIVDK